MTEEQVRARRHRGRRHRRPSVRDLPEIFFCGDPHGTFDQINEAARLYSPDAMVILATFSRRRRCTWCWRSARLYGHLVDSG